MKLFQEPDNQENQTETPDELKEKGNQAVREERYSEAVLHYSFAIKLSPNDPILYSNRSLAFLKLKQLYYANEDAIKAIKLKPDWAKVLPYYYLLLLYYLPLTYEMIYFVGILPACTVLRSSCTV